MQFLAETTKQNKTDPRQFRAETKVTTPNTRPFWTENCGYCENRTETE